jgi:hypothetical protein
MPDFRFIRALDFTGSRLRIRKRIAFVIFLTQASQPLIFIKAELHRGGAQLQHMRPGSTRGVAMVLL